HKRPLTPSSSEHSLLSCEPPYCSVHLTQTPQKERSIQRAINFAEGNMGSWSPPFLIPLAANERWPLREGTNVSVAAIVRNIGPGNLQIHANSVPPGKTIFVNSVDATLIAGANPTTAEVTFNSV